MRERAADLVDLDFGPRTTRDIEQALRAEIERERLTSIDRSLLRGIGGDRIVAAHGANAFDQTVRAGRLAKLARLGLAEPVGAGRWRLAPGLDDTLRRMGERGDIIRTMQRVFTRAALDRAAADQVIYDPAPPDARPLVGRVVTRGLADEHADRHYLIVDATDGRSHYVAIGRGDTVDALAIGAIVRIDPLRPAVRAVDLTVAEVAAANQGHYDIDAHLRHDPSATQDCAETHVRRLEAMRRAGAGVERDPSGIWTIASDHLGRAAAHETTMLRDRPVTVQTLSPQPLEKQVGHAFVRICATRVRSRWLSQIFSSPRNCAFPVESIGSDPIGTGGAIDMRCNDRTNKEQIGRFRSLIDAMRQSSDIADLRARIAELESGPVRHAPLPIGVDALDCNLPGGGLASGGLHEIAGSPALADDASATIFLAGILARIEGPVFRCLRRRDLFAPTLHLAGLHPDRVIHVEAGSDTEVLLTMEECLRHPGLAGVVARSPDNLRSLQQSLSR